MKQICSDLSWEQKTLDALVSGLTPERWADVTFCDGWTVKDEICHLAYFDHTARLASTDADAFKPENLLPYFSEFGFRRGSWGDNIFALSDLHLFG